MPKERVNLSVPSDVKEWMGKNPTINYSDIFTRTVRDHMDGTPIKKNPLFFVACVGAIIMGVTLILVSTLPFMTWEIRIFLPLLGGIMAFLSAVVYFKEYGRVRRTNSNGKK